MSPLIGHWYRGGTSKCWLFTADQLPRTREQIASVLAEAFGASDERQLEGIGGGTSTTSKAAVVETSGTPGIDVNYLFAQVGIGDGQVEFTSNCGNCASAVALFALQQGMVAPDGDVTTVRLYSHNTGTVIRAVVATPQGQAPTSGDALIPGVSLPGVGVDVLFEDVDGTSTGNVLPTGKSVESFDLNGDAHEATCIDAGAPSCFVSATGALARVAFDSSVFPAELVDQLVDVREQASHRMALTPPGTAPSPAVPKTGLLGEPTDYRTISGQLVTAAEYDVRVTMLSMYAPHPAIGITSAVALARSAAIQGTTAQKLWDGTRASTEAGEFSLRLGTPSGVITAVYREGTGQQSPSVGVFRSARHLADAKILLDENSSFVEGAQA